ncbi:phage tail protein [Vibrio quintilis]|uniref:Phage Tail Collar Domain protein n=1 Tax=Vibrio quintilis TaxID=1117707 RepID=A0A1M7YZ63_9VIBR|nr:tail fiber protein [Vibrio quintilis]SHO57842.1 Phage Tail Collar Domain protein [Vibrio quintilis]
MSDPFIGEIMMWGFKFAPVHYAKCDGQPLEISQYNALFALVYNTFGGDGRVNFQLPDLRGRAPMHIGYGIDIGDKYGFESVVLTEANTGHRHLVTASANQAEEITPFDTHSGAGNFPAVAQGVDLYGVPSGTVALAPDALTSTGGNKSHSNMQPSLVINFCIALEGVFPSRS